MDINIDRCECARARACGRGRVCACGRAWGCGGVISFLLWLVVVYVKCWLCYGLKVAFHHGGLFVSKYKKKIVCWCDGVWGDFLFCCAVCWCWCCDELEMVLGFF